MKTYHRSFLAQMLNFIGLWLVTGGVLWAQTTAFTYQGKLTEAGSPANGIYDLQFRLFDAAVNGSQVGLILSREDVAVSNGLFSTTLDFGASAFPGANRWLEIALRTGTSTGSFTLLSPRQPISATPYALQSLSATTAENATQAATAINFSGPLTGEITGTQNATVVAAVAGQSASAVALGVTLANTATALNTPNTLVRRDANGNFAVGTITGNGSGLSNVPGTLPWHVVSGTTQQAQPNTGYVITNPTTPVTITLPTAPNIGDTLRITGAGSGGWQIAQNATQSIIGANLFKVGVNWTPHESSRNWVSVASSADGNRLVAVVYAGYLYTSLDAGISWTERETPKYWSAVASSADGSKLVAVGGQGVFTSTDFGVSWTSRGLGSFLISVASSADGNNLIVASTNQIYTSTDAGLSWTPREEVRNWRAVATSADGSQLVAVEQNGQIYTSSDAGEHWTPHESNRQWVAVASSADGGKLAAVVYGGQIYTSTDFGLTWTPRESNRNWFSVASSANGSGLVAVVKYGQVYISNDFGLTWLSRDQDRNWFSATSSADGSKLAAVVSGGQIYTSSPSAGGNTTVGAAGSLTGAGFTAIELQYIGNGQFLPLSYIGVPIVR